MTYYDIGSVIVHNAAFELAKQVRSSCECNM